MLGLLSAKKGRGDSWRSHGQPCRGVLQLPVHKFGVLRYPYFSTPTPGVMYLGRGWKSFARIHSLTAGFTLHFKLVGDDLLSVKAFGDFGTQARCCVDSSSDSEGSSSSESDEEGSNSDDEGGGRRDDGSD